MTVKEIGSEPGQTPLAFNAPLDERQTTGCSKGKLQALASCQSAEDTKADFQKVKGL